MIVFLCCGWTTHFPAAVVTAFSQCGRCAPQPIADDADRQRHLADRMNHLDRIATAMLRGLTLCRGVGAHNLHTLHLNF